MRWIREPMIASTIGLSAWFIGMLLFLRIVAHATNEQLRSVVAGFAPFIAFWGVALALWLVCRPAESRQTGK